MSKIEKIERSLAWLSIVISLMGLVLAIILFWHHGISATQFWILFIMYFLTEAGIEVGYHRHFTHRSFKAHPIIRTLLAILGSMAFQGPVIFWAGIHRQHHNHSDQVGDPHSPKPQRKGVNLKLRGYWHAYIGWLFKFRHDEWVSQARFLFNDKIAMKISRTYLFWLMLGLLLPAIAGGILTQTRQGIFEGFIWGGLFRIFLVQQINYILNIIGHASSGSRAFQTKDSSHNHGWLSLPTLGASWHNNHHAFPHLAETGLKWWQIDMGGWLIKLLEKSGLAWDVNHPKQKSIKNFLYG